MSNLSHLSLETNPSYLFALEDHLETYLSKNIHLIEEGMKVIARQSQVGKRYIDILAVDRNGVMCLIELKTALNDPRLIDQCIDYSDSLNGKGRLIVIAPSYDLDQLKTMESIGSIEIKQIGFEKGCSIPKVIDVDHSNYKPFEYEFNFDDARSEKPLEKSYSGPKEEFNIGNTMVVVHSPLVTLSKEERKKWFLDEWEKGNPVLKEIAAAVHACYRD
ncbi:endonuclease NucS domain-containing protein [Metabacillus idriensis]|uniref:endonuclease NucS domain-containing protein n=1 Tax=Metabacillus idriensis TaxID=324768 RepID=UPI0017494B98|nr:endonuclease NucS domain-containing protein [Metabacillus idriensis]